MVLSVPSKSFLIGEYGVLTGGPALLVNTAPRFELRVRAGLDGKNPFHPESPAGKLYTENASYLKKFDISFFDPHHRRGGLGASSAQFALLYALLNQNQIEDSFKMLEQYKRLSERKSGLPPSGYDVLAQKTGGVSVIEAKLRICETLPWNFKNIGFYLIRTGHKVDTHKHLGDLKKLDVNELSEIAGHAVQTFISGHEPSFLENIKLFQAALTARGLTAPTTTSLLENLNANPKVLAAKGCGALGADIVILFFDSKNRDELRQELRKVYEIVGEDLTLQEGLRVEVPVEVEPAGARFSEGLQ